MFYVLAGAIARGELGSWNVVREAQVAAVLPILVLAERRITPDELSLLEDFVDALPEPMGVQNHVRFGLLFWKQIARATRNPLWEAQIIQQGSLLRELFLQCPQNGNGDLGPGLADIYRALVDALRTRTVSSFWLKVIDSSAATYS
jgi:DNA-binding FadR family transcriptional regulator